LAEARYVAALSQALADQSRLHLAHYDLIVLRRREYVPVGIEGHLHGRMAHQRLHPLGRKSLLDKKAGRSVPESVQAVLRMKWVISKPGRDLQRPPNPRR